MTPSDTISAGDMPYLAKDGQKGDYNDLSADADSLREAKMEFEKQYLAKKLREFDGNISRTAESIGLERSNLHRKIKSYGLEVKSE